MVTVASQEEQNKAFVLEYMKAFGTFDPDVYYPYLAENPTYMAGMNIRQGREAFKANTDAGKLLYPKPDEAVNEHIAVIAEGDWVAVLLKRRAETNKVKDYENLYAMKGVDWDDPTIAQLSAQRGVHPVEVIIDLTLQNENQIFVQPLVNEHPTTCSAC